METTISDSMTLKVSELLKEVKLDISSPPVSKIVSKTVKAIKEAISVIPDNIQVTKEIAPGFVKDVGADKVDFKFSKPASFSIAGSYSFGCVVKPDVNVDLFIGLPKECFHEKDYLNNRYHAKRFLYLCVLKKYLNLSSSIQKVEWSFLQNEARKPLLLVYPAKKVDGIPEFCVKIIPTATSLFDISKLDLKRNNVRSVNQEGVLQATPKYSTSILEDMCLEDSAELVRKTFLEWKELGEALVLLKVWARQRGSVYSHDCLNGFLISVILCYLVSVNRINKNMTPMQIFRTTLTFIASSKWIKGGIYIKHEGQKTISNEEKLQYKDIFPAVICDSSNRFNFGFRMTSNGLSELQDEAELTIQCLGKCRDGGFEEVFMTKVDYPSRYDYCIRLSMKEANEIYAAGFCLDDECWRLCELKVHSLLCQALGDRAKLIRVTWKNTASESSIENGLSTLTTEPLFVGILVSSLEKSFRVVDIGPNAESKEEAIKFRKFWGEKSELRRFKDGRIAESTVWECEQWRRHLILTTITEYVLMRHLSLPKENIVHIVDQLDFSLQHGVGDPISITGSLLGAFEELSNRLRLIQDIPLKIYSVQPLDPAFRFTSVFPPEPHPVACEKGNVSKLRKLTPSCVQPLEVIIQLEGSGNWPMDEIAIEKTKTAFLLKIAESLQNSWGMTCTATENDVDVFMSGYAFRLKILHERGLSLLGTGSNPTKKVPSMDKKLFIRGQHASMINGLQGRYPIYGPVVRLSKRWVASHLFSACLIDEAVELLVAHLFLRPLPFHPPCSRMTGFLRFLRLLSEYDWTFSAMIVDINNGLTPDDEKEINDNFMQSRKDCEENLHNVNPALFLATAYDKSSDAWTKSSPTVMELKRLMAYARSSANLLSKLILQNLPDTYRWEQLFRTPLSNYDAVVLLHRDRLPYPQRLLFPSELSQGLHVAHGDASKAFHPFMVPKDLKSSSEELSNKLMVDFDPLRCLVGDLKNEFPETFKLWFDSLGGDAIGLTWEKSSSKKRGREEEDDELKNKIDNLKAVGEAGKGFVRDVYLLKAQNRDGSRNSFCITCVGHIIFHNNKKKKKNNKILT